MKNLLELLKKIPIDLGQGALAERTMGKQIARSLVPVPTGKARALDVGARDGVQTRWLRDMGYRVTPIDIDVRFPGCLQVDANNPLPFADASFDLVWCSEVIEHLKSPPRFLQEVRRILKPGGSAILTTPNSYAWFFRLFAFFGLPPNRLQRPDHLHFFSLDEIRRIAPEATVYGYFPYMIIKRRITRGLGLLTPTFVIHIVKPKQT